MIKYNTREWFGLIFAFHKSDTFRKLLGVMLVLVIYCEGIVYFNRNIYQLTFFPSPVLHTLLGLVLSLLLVFRTNTAYDRWWEGRKLWGSLLNSSRNLALKLNAMLDPGDRAKRELFANAISEYAVLLKHHLTGDGNSTHRHEPNAKASEMFEAIHQLYKSKQISGEELLMLNNEFQSFTDICGACERIKKTPIPYSYNMFIKKFIFIYVVTLPFSFGNEFGYGIAFITVFTFYVLGSLELIAEEIEDPFGKDANDLPLNSIAVSVHRSVKEILLGEGKTAGS